MLKRYFLLLSAAFFSLSAHNQVLIITHAFNRPDFIEMQCRTFKKFFKDDYRFVLFNDANNEPMSAQIKVMCQEWGIECIRVPQEIHDRPYHKRWPGEPYHRPNIRHANAIQYSLDTLGFNHDGILLIIDSDMFPVRPFSITEYMKDADTAGVFRGFRPDGGYIWPGICFLNMATLPNKRDINFNCGFIDGYSVDVGGHTYCYFRDNPTVTKKGITEISSYQLFCPHTGIPMRNCKMDTPQAEQIRQLKEHGFNDKEITFLQKRPHTVHFNLNNIFFHHGAGTNYENYPYEHVENKRKMIFEFLESVLAE